MKKMICWAYQTSPNAKQFGFHDVGCWIVELTQNLRRFETLAGFATLEEAVMFAYMVEADWEPLFLQYAYNPNNPISEVFE